MMCKNGRPVNWWDKIPYWIGYVIGWPVIRAARVVTAMVDGFIHAAMESGDDDA